MEEKTGKLSRALAGGRTVRVLGLDLTSVARSMCDAHKLSGPAAQLASEALVATGLMSGQIKGEERLTLQIRFEGFSGSFMGEIDAQNNLRGMMRPARVRWKEGDLLAGTVLAIKHNAEKELYRGVTHLAHKSIESALVEHLETSSQLDVIVRIGSKMGPNGRPEWVGGVVIEKLPGGEADDGFEGRFGGLREAKLQEELGRLEDGWLLNEEMDVLEIWKLRWRCKCSLERVRLTLLGLGEQVLREIQQDPGYAGVTCHFCNQTYRIEGDDLRRLIQQVEQA